MAEETASAGWPDRGIDLASWINSGREAWLLLGVANGWQPTEGSPLRLDDLTLHAGARSSNSGWFSRLSMLGAADMLSGVATLYAATPAVPLSRAHFPIARSIQEHLGQVIWLLEPGSLVTHDGQQPPVASHDLDADLFRARSRRAAMLYWKFLDDACSSVRLEFGEGSAEHTEAVSNRTEAKHIVAELSGDTNAFPSSTDFANMTIQFVYKLNGQAVTDATKHVYKRLSETAHGGLYGLYGDKTV